MFHYLKETYRSLTKRNIAKKQKFEHFNNAIVTEMDFKTNNNKNVTNIFNKCFLIVSVIQMVNKNCTGLYTVINNFFFILFFQNPNVQMCSTVL